MSKNQLFNPIRDELIGTCLVPEAEQMSDGAIANNRLALERLDTKPELYRRVVRELGWLANSYEADLLLPVPDGANWLAEAVSLETGVDYGLLYKSDDGSYDCLPDTREKLAAADSVVIIGDVLNQLTATKKVLAIPGATDTARAVLGVFDRGPHDRDRLDIPVRALVRRPIPTQLANDDKLWRLTRSA